MENVHELVRVYSLAISDGLELLPDVIISLLTLFQVVIVGLVHQQNLGWTQLLPASPKMVLVNLCLFFEIYSRQLLHCLVYYSTKYLLQVSIVSNEQLELL